MRQQMVRLRLDVLRITFKPQGTPEEEKTNVPPTP